MARQQLNRDPINLLETSPNRNQHQHKRKSSSMNDGEIIDTSLSPIQINTNGRIMKHDNKTRKIKNSSLLSLSSNNNNNNNTSVISNTRIKNISIHEEKNQDDLDDTIEGEDILDKSPVRFMIKENVNSPRTITVPLKKNEENKVIRKGTPITRKVFELHNKIESDDDEFQSEDEEEEQLMKSKQQRQQQQQRRQSSSPPPPPPPVRASTPPRPYKFPSLITSTVLSSKLSNKFEIHESPTKEDTPKKRRIITTPKKVSDESIDISDTISKAEIFINLKRKELMEQQMMAKESTKDTTGKILNFEEEENIPVEREVDEEEESEELIDHRKKRKKMRYKPLEHWEITQWNKLIKFLKIYKITQNDEMLSRESIRQRFNCDLEELSSRIIILNKLNERNQNKS